MEWIKNWFSNMLPFDSPMIYQGIAFNTVENFYQAMKIKDIEGRKKLAAMDPYKAKKAIRDKINFTWREDWTKDMSLQVMEYALRYKFRPGNSWGKKLIETGNEEIIEWNNWNDTFWGKNVTTKEGENHLGIILMKIREDIKNG